MKKQFWRFLAAGGAAAVANFGSRFFFNLWVPFEWAVVLAFLVGLTVGFLLMRGYVFNAGGKPVARQVAVYVLVNLIALLQTLLVSIALERWLLPTFGVAAQAEAVAHLAGVLVPIITSYFGHQMVTFK